MSLVTCVNLNDKVSLMSDGLAIGENGETHDTQFQKFLVRENFFIAITNSYIVAKEIFKDIKLKNISANSIKEYINDLYSEINKEFNIIIGLKINNRFSYYIYSHFDGEYEKYEFGDLTGVPLVMNSSNVDENVVSEFHNEIKRMYQSKELSSEIVKYQESFHDMVSKLDYTVNNVLFQEVFYKN